MFIALFNVTCVTMMMFCVSVHDTVHLLYNSIYLSLWKSYFNDELVVWYNNIISVDEIQSCKTYNVATIFVQ